MDETSVSKVIQHDKTVKNIFDEQIEESLLEHKRSNFGVFISSLSAGLEVGFSAFCIVLVLSLFKGEIHPSYLHMLKGIAYSVGFIFVSVSRSELFTEQTALSLLPVLNKRVSIKSLMGLWGAVIAGNLLGCFIFSLILLKINTSLSLIKISAFGEIARDIVAFSNTDLLVSAIIAGWLMALLSWMSTSCNDTISKIFMVFLVTSIIGIGNLHHSILGATEVLLGMFTSDDITIGIYLNFQFWALLGNILGGTIFVGILKYSYIRFSKT